MSQHTGIYAVIWGHGRSDNGRHPGCGYEAMTRDDELCETVHPAWRVPYIAQVSVICIRDI